MNTGGEVSYVFYDENIISGTGRNGVIDPQDIIYFFENRIMAQNRPPRLRIDKKRAEITPKSLGNPNSGSNKQKPKTQLL